MTPDAAARLFGAMKDGDAPTSSGLVQAASGWFEAPVAAPLIGAVPCERILCLGALLGAGAVLDYRDENIKGSS